MAQLADQMTAATPALASASADNRFDHLQSPDARGARSVTISRDQRGHFSAQGRIDGRSLDFMVDTGASVVALNARSAGKLGIYPTPRDYKVKVATANGIIHAASARLPRVDIGGLIVENVEALVLPDAALSENLLGLSYLSKLKRFEMAGSRMVLEQ
jgi:aspartyl protease family protein